MSLWTLPDEIFKYFIMPFLSLEDMGELSMVSKEWHVMINRHRLYIPAFKGFRYMKTINCTDISVIVFYIVHKHGEVDPRFLWNAIDNGPSNAMKVLCGNLPFFCANQIFRWGCEYGRLEMVMWMANRYHLVTEDARGHNNHALRESCKHGRLETAKWLVSRFRFNVNDIRTNNNEALRWACDYGHIETIMWMVDYFKLSRDDITSSDNEAIRWCCENGHLELAKWLVKRFKLGRDDLEQSGAMEASHRMSQIAVVNWLSNTFNIHLRRSLDLQFVF